jgi:O-antigen/teichoic acid export membrane protein
MRIAFKALKASTLLALGQLTSYGASFLRNIILARALTKADFGIAAAISLMMSAFELSSKLSIGQQVIQAKDGDHEDFQATAQGCQFLAGCAGAALIAVFGGPMAHLFKVPQAGGAFVLMSLLGILNGLQHLDVMRFTRLLNFGKRVIVDVVPDVTTALACYPVVLWLKDYRAVVCLLMMRGLLLLAVSHWIADRPYRWHFNQVYIRRILGFSWPLLVNALLMFGYQQGDQVIIGAHFSMASLAQYSLAVSITMVPGFMFQYVINTVMLPLLSQVQDDPERYRRRYLFCAELSTVAGVLIACFLILGGELVIVTAFGKKYAGSGAIVGWLAVANAFRIIRAVPTLAAMARGDTINNMVSNLYRVSSLGLAVLAIFSGKSILWVAACGVFGELLALGASWRRLRDKCGIPVLLGMKSAAIAALIVAFCSGVVLLLGSYSSSIKTLLLCVAGCPAAFLIMWRLFGEFRRHALETMSHAPAIGPLTRALAWCGSV